MMRELRSEAFFLGHLRELDEPDKTGAPDAVGFWAFALPSPDGSVLLAEWSGECESQMAFFAQADGSNPVPVTGERGLVGAPSSSVIGWMADGGALVFLGPGGECGSGDAPAGVYRFERPGVGAMMVAVPEPNGVRMWGPRKRLNVPVLWSAHKELCRRMTKVTFSPTWTRLEDERLG